MKFAPLNNDSYVLRLELGDDVHEAIQRFCVDNDIANASVEGIGSLDSPTLAHYSIKTKHFTNKQLTGIFEVTSLLGNIALVDDKPFAHLHVTVSDSEMIARGGHLVSGTCSATLEIIIKNFTSRHRKIHDDAIGLKVWDFDAH